MEPPKVNTTGISQSSNVSMAPGMGAQGQNSAMTRGGNRKPMLSASGVPAMHARLDDDVPEEAVPEEEEKKRNYTYASLPDDYADTKLVEPPRTNNFNIDYATDMKPEEFVAYLQGLNERKELLRKLNKPSESYLNWNTFPHLNDTYAAAASSNEAMQEDVDEEIEKLTTHYVDQELEKQTSQKPKYWNVEYKRTGDDDALRVMESTSLFNEGMKLVEGYGSSEITVGKCKLYVTESSSSNLSDKEAYAMHIYLQTAADYQVETENDIVGGMFEAIPVLGDLYSIGEIIETVAIGPQPVVTAELIDQLGGEYRTYDFFLRFDWDFRDPQLGDFKGEDINYKGVLFIGEPILLEDGTVIENPCNFYVITKIES